MRHLPSEEAANPGCCPGGYSVQVAGLLGLPFAFAHHLMITTMVHDPADRLRSFELVAALAAQARTEDTESVSAAKTG